MLRPIVDIQKLPHLLNVVGSVSMVPFLLSYNFEQNCRVQFLEIWLVAMSYFKFPPVSYGYKKVRNDRFNWPVMKIPIKEIEYAEDGSMIYSTVVFPQLEVN